MLPPFPVDDATLDLLSTAISPGPEAEGSSVGDLLILYSELGGSDTEAVAEVVDEGDSDLGLGLAGAEIVIMRDPVYHVHDVMSALIDEIRRLRRTTIAEEVTEP